MHIKLKHLFVSSIERFTHERDLDTVLVKNALNLIIVHSLQVLEGDLVEEILLFLS